jgi:hypothetical protein
MNTNCRGPKRMLQLAQQCRQLQAYVHVSTAYVNCNQPSGTRIMEELPVVSYDGDDLLEEIARLPTEAIVARTPGWLGKYPNTYTFTKALGEWLLHKHRGQVARPPSLPAPPARRDAADRRRVMRTRPAIPRRRAAVRRVGGGWGGGAPAGSGAAASRDGGPALRGEQGERHEDALSAPVPTWFHD